MRFSVSIIFGGKISGCAVYGQGMLMYINIALIWLEISCINTFVDVRMMYIRVFEDKNGRWKREMQKISGKCRLS